MTTTLESGGWRIHVVHETGFTYAGEARGSYNEVRLTPLSQSAQTVLASEIRISPSADRWAYSDYWNNRVTTFQLDDPHETLKVTAESTVETAGSASRAGDLSFKQLSDPTIRDALDEYLSPTGRTSLPPDAIVDLAAPLVGDDLHATVDAIGEVVRSELSYETGATGVQTSAQEALLAGRGVCQDFTHLTLALLRGIGVPARYVSGYLYPDEEAQPGAATMGESHAWVEYFSGVWNAIDPTGGIEVGPRHIVTARGRDYSDAAPLTGIYHGAPATSLGVTVAITRLR